MTDQAALFPEPARRSPTWTHTNTRACIYFDVRDAPDIQDGRTTRRRIMRPTHLDVLTTGITVNVVQIHGPAVRRDGTLGALQTRTYSTTPDPRQPAPPMARRPPRRAWPHVPPHPDPCRRPRPRPAPPPRKARR